MLWGGGLCTSREGHPVRKEGGPDPEDVLVEVKAKKKAMSCSRSKSGSELVE